MISIKSIATSILIFSSLSLQAQIEKRTLTTEIQTGFGNDFPTTAQDYLKQDAQQAGIYPAISATSFNRGYSLSANINKYVHDLFSIGARVSFASKTYEVDAVNYNPISITTTSKVTNYRTRIMARGVFNIVNINKFQLYSSASFGLGIQSLTKPTVLFPNASSTKYKTSLFPTYFVSLGSSYFITQKLGVNVEGGIGEDMLINVGLSYKIN